jgi:hypothetical protein
MPSEHAAVESAFALGRFNLDDAGAEIRQDETGTGTGADPRELENPYSSEGAVHHGAFPSQLCSRAARR